ncbi:hypothetical protein ACFO3J_13020 [Streptomyces polygonati]|uniref:MftR C-terminal domain-containing protein n=1 Tax=Streptomyces polygonati TaxID=1617087 RepID=A0ABV8HQJ2_9ACTN
MRTTARTVISTRCARNRSDPSRLATLAVALAVAEKLSDELDHALPPSEEQLIAAIGTVPT